MWSLWTFSYSAPVFLPYIILKHVLPNKNNKMKPGCVSPQNIHSQLRTSSAL